MKFPLPRRQWPYWTVGTLLAVGVLIWQTPSLIQRQLPPWLEQHYGLRLDWDTPEFGRRELVLAHVTLRDRQGKPLLAWERLSFSPKWWDSLRTRTLRLHDLRLSRPELTLVRSGERRLNLLDALTPFTQETAASSSAGTAPPLEIDRLTVEGGKVHYRDGRDLPKAQHDPEMDLTALTASVQGVNLRGSGALPFQLTARLNGAPLSSQGELKLAPWQIKGEASLETLNLSPLAPLWRPWVQLTLPKGSASAKLAFQASEQGWHVTQGALTLDGWQIRRGNPMGELPSEIARFKRLTLDGIDIDGTRQRLTIKRVRWDSPHLVTRLDEQYLPDFMPLLLPATKAPEPRHKAGSRSEKPWHWQVGQVTLKGGSVDLSEPSSGKQRLRSLRQLEGHLGPLDDRAGNVSQLQVSTRVDDLANFRLAGTLSLTPFTLNAALEQETVPLGWAQAYLQNYLRARIETGTLNGRQQLVLEQDGDGAWRQATLNGTLTVQDLKVVDKRDNLRLLSWQKMTMNNLKADLRQLRVEIDKVLLEQPYSRIEIDKDGSTNLQTLLLPAAPSGSSQGPEPQLTVDEVVTRQGNLRFADRRLSRDFVVDIAALNGSTRHISNIPGHRADIALQGKVDRYAPVTIAGSANLLVDKPVLDMTASFKNLELTTFTPYSATYAGYAIDKGQLSMRLKYQLQGSTLEGSNDIRINKLQLGDKVESPEALDLPLKLAVALLADSDGVISLDLKVKGDLDNPDFSVGSLLWNVVGNTLRKAVTSPFSLLASLAGSHEELDEIRFNPGDITLPEAQAPRIASLASALRQRPQLALNLRGEVDRGGDLQALQRMQLENQLGKELERSISLEQIGQDPQLQDALDSLYASTFAQSIDALAFAHQLVPGSQSAWQLGIDTLAAKQPVSDKSLRRLATLRAQAIKTKFVENYDISPERIFVLDSKPGDAKSQARVLFSTEAN